MNAGTRGRNATGRRPGGAIADVRVGRGLPRRRGLYLGPPPRYPDRIPVGVVAHVRCQPRSDGILDSVTGAHVQVFVPSQCVVVVRTLSERTGAPEHVVDDMRRTALEPAQDAVEPEVTFERKQPVQRVGHQHPGGRGGPASLCAFAQFSDRGVTSRPTLPRC